MCSVNRCGECALRLEKSIIYKRKPPRNCKRHHVVVSVNGKPCADAIPLAPAVPTDKTKPLF